MLNSELTEAGRLETGAYVWAYAHQEERKKMELTDAGNIPVHRTAYGSGSQ